MLVASGEGVKVRGEAFGEVKEGFGEARGEAELVVESLASLQEKTLELSETVSETAVVSPMPLSRSLVGVSPSEGDLWGERRRCERWLSSGGGRGERLVGRLAEEAWNWLSCSVVMTSCRGDGVDSLSCGETLPLGTLSTCISCRGERSRGDWAVIQLPAGAVDAALSRGEHGGTRPSRLVSESAKKPFRLGFKTLT